MSSGSTYVECNFKEVYKHCQSDLILLVTATDIETEQTHLKMEPVNGFDCIAKVFEGDLTYYFGMLGNYSVAHVQTTSMGSMARGSSIMTVTSALKLLKTNIVVMVGIAFGVDKVKQNVGDVLISESVIPYNSKRVGKEGNVQRGIEAPSSKILLNRFKNIGTTWEYIIDDGSKARLIPTRLLSGEELVDNVEYRNELIAKNPDSKGGEMEGAGVYAACDGTAEWIIVKGICDFADGEKGKGKKEKQTIAINSALSVCLEIFNSKTAFKELNVSPFSPESTVTEKLNSQTNINDVLFDIYDDDKERYYIERSADSDFCNIIKQYGIWIHGPSGSGKTNLIIRNLKIQKSNFIQVSLAACIGLDIDSFFKEVLYELIAKTEDGEEQIEPGNFTECSKEILKILKKHYSKKELIIFIEEIPISDDLNYKYFSEKLFSLLISKKLTGGLDNVKFVLSSIDNPEKNIQVFQQKIHQQLNFLPFVYWNEEEINELIDLIEKEFQFILPEDVKTELIAKAMGSPRFIKKFFRSIYTLNRTDIKTLQNIISETSRELNQFRDA